MSCVWKGAREGPLFGGGQEGHVYCGPSILLLCRTATEHVKLFSLFDQFTDSSNVHGYLTLDLWEEKYTGPSGTLLWF